MSADVSRVINIHFGEVALKGGNRSSFENLLISNIGSALAQFGKFSVRKTESRLVVTPKGEFDEVSVRKALSNVFGIEFFSISLSTKADVEDLKKAVLSHSSSLSGKSIRVETKRSDKRFPLTSQRINEIIGAALVDAGCSVDLENPEETVFIEVLSDRALISLERVRGPGGLPVGCSGKVLSLLSGGIDSPVSSWMMLKRGCDVDFLHVHPFADNKEAVDSKIMKLAKALRAYSPSNRPVRLFVVPYNEFYKKSIAMDQKSELVVFRRFIIRLANGLAKKHGYRGLVTGDSLGQVASQTLGNLYATNEASEMPVFRPLIGFNKQEIVDLAKKVGTYDLSIEEYKDCCSLVAYKNPSTNVKLEIAKKIEDEIKIDEVVEKTLEQVEVVEL